MTDLKEYGEYCSCDSYTEVQLHMQESKIEEVYPLQPQDVYQICVGAHEVAKAEGLCYPHIILQPKYEPYDGDCLGISVIPYGFRVKTEEEIEKDKWRGKVNVLATKLGLSYYEAEVIYNSLDKIKEYLND